MTSNHEEKRRAPRRDAWSRAVVLWLDEDQSYSVRGHVRDYSADGCSIVSLSSIPVPIGALSVPGLDINRRFRVSHSRREGLLQVTGVEFLAHLPRD